jgi:uncharacterized coiled-coil DUF342 family protein
MKDLQRAKYKSLTEELTPYSEEERVEFIEEILTELPLSVKEGDVNSRYGKKRIKEVHARWNAALTYYGKIAPHRLTEIKGKVIHNRSYLNGLFSKCGFD